MDVLVLDRIKAVAKADCVGKLANLFLATGQEVAAGLTAGAPITLEVHRFFFGGDLIRLARIEADDYHFEVLAGGVGNFEQALGEPVEHQIAEPRTLSV